MALDEGRNLSRFGWSPEAEAGRIGPVERFVRSCGLVSSLWCPPRNGFRPQNDGVFPELELATERVCSSHDGSIGPGLG